MNITINPGENKDDIHQCTSRREGDWFIFTCPKCVGYERRLNFKTQEMRTKGDTNWTIRHRGGFVPVGLEQFASSSN